MSKPLLLGLALAALTAFCAPAHAENTMMFRYKGALAGPAGGGDGTNPDGPGNGGGDNGGSETPPGGGNEDLAYQLKDATLPDATEGQSWSFDFGGLLEPAPNDMSEVEWRMEPYPGKDMPSDVSWTGPVLAGAPVNPGSLKFYVVATVNGKDFKRLYSLDVKVVPVYAKMIVKGNGLYVLTEDGAVWFDNGSNVPAKVPGLESGVAAVYGGASHRCVIKTGGSVWCWGNNSYGEIGNGEIGYNGVQGAAVPSPVQVQGLGAPAVSLTSGYYNTCAVLDNGHIKCWGNNGYGQIGNGSTAMFGVETLPTDIVPVDPLDWGELNSFRKLDFGTNHVCGVTTIDRVWCWGYNLSGQVGDGSVTTKKTKPLAVQGLPGPVRDVAAGDNFSCAAMESGSVYCWGSGSKGTIGNGRKDSSNPVPQLVEGIGNAIALSATYQHVCALLADGRAMCWGAGDYGQLGDGQKITSSVPVSVLNGKSDIIDVKAMALNTCVLDAARRIYCFGYGAMPFSGEETQRPWEGASTP